MGSILNDGEGGFSSLEAIYAAIKYLEPRQVHLFRWQLQSSKHNSNVAFSETAH